MERNIFDEIRRQVDIVEIVSHYISISKHGKDYVGLCPFHSDNNPSLHVSPEKQIYKCFSCGAAGNVFTFVQNYEKVNAVEALKRVCQIANLPIPEQFQREVKVQVDPNARYHQLMKDLANFYNLQLNTEEGIEALTYLKDRNITNDDISYFKIGYCNEDPTKSIDFLRNKGYSDSEIHSCGVTGAGNEMKDHQRGRIVFPICDYKGRVVAFSGRKFRESDKDAAKYVNTPESVIFHKSNVLYNYHNASVNSRREGYCYIVEGFMDAIALHKSGLKNVVATMGTAFTDNHKKLLNELKCEIRLFFDSDEPGQNTTIKSVESLNNQQFTTKVVKPMIGRKDIDEVLKNDGKDAVIEIANNLQNTVEYSLDYYAKRTNFKNHESMKNYISKAINVLVNSKLDDIDLEVYLARISNETKLNVSVLKQEYNKNTKTDYYPEYETYDISPEVVKKHLNKYEQADHQILKMMIDSELNIVLYKTKNISLCTKTCRQLAALIIDAFNKGKEISYASLISDAEDNTELINLISDLSEETYPESKLEELIKIVSDDFLIKIDVEDLERQLKEAVTLQEKIEIGNKIIEIKKRNKIEQQ